MHKPHSSLMTSSSSCSTMLRSQHGRQPMSSLGEQVGTSTVSASSSTHSIMKDKKRKKENVDDQRTCLSDSDDDDELVIIPSSPSPKPSTSVEPLVPRKKIRNISELEKSTSQQASSVVILPTKRAEKEEENTELNNHIEYENTNMIDTILKRKRDNDGKMKYFVKLRGQSHWHCEWLSREEVQQNATLKLMWFEDHYGRDLEIDLFNPNCEKIEQIIASNGNNFFVKWKDVPYSGCTWETKKDISKHGYNADLFYTFITTHRKKAYKIHSEEELSKKRMESQNSAHDISKISVTNVGGHSFELFDYQLQGVAWMKSMWIQHKNCMLCDQPGLGKTTQVVSFLRAMTIYNIVPGPFLIISPRNRIEHWKEQINFWAPDLRVAVYDGLHEDRIIIKQFIIQTIQKRDLTPTDRMNFSVNIILTTSESMVDDEKWFNYFLWPIAVVDQAHVLKRTKSNLYLILKEMKVDFKLFM